MAASLPWLAAALCLVLYAGFAWWLAEHPAALPSDDALFFARGLTRFDVLDFAPQFPGYPGFIAMGRLVLALVHDPVRALFIVTTAVALLIPPAAAALAWRVTGRQACALAAFAVTLTTPLLPDLALSLLSDGAGILFLLAALALLPADRAAPRQPALPWLAGAALGWAACCRPSDAVLLAGAFAGIAWRLPRTAPAVLGGALVVGLPALAVLYAHEGTLYLWEASRFLAGHTIDWGNTPFAAGGPHGSWLASIAAVPGGIAVAALTIAAGALTLARGRRLPPALSAMALAFFADALWIALMQNPEHLRHLAPLAVLGGLLAVLAPKGPWRAAATAALLAANAGILALTLDPVPGRLPPLARAAGQITVAPAGSAVALNEGVAVLRESLPTTRVYDMQSPAAAALGLAAARGAAYRLSTTPLGPPPLAVFRGRVLGEETMYLYAAGEVFPNLAGS